MRPASLALCERDLGVASATTSAASPGRCLADKHIEKMELNAMIDPGGFKQAARHWASGVAVITTTGANGEYLGATMSAVSPLSIDPPLFLICANRSSDTGAAIRRSGIFCINILARDQGHLCALFAGKGIDKFSSVQAIARLTGAPMLVGAACCIECRVHAVHDGGDHSIIVGAVVDVAACKNDPLVYHGSRYHALSAVV